MDAVARSPHRRRAAVFVTGAALAGFGGSFAAVAAGAASGEAAGHVLFHAVSGLAALALAVGCALLWRPRESSGERGARTALIVSLWAFAAASLIEAIGAFGYGADGFAVRSELLRSVHNTATGASGLAMMAVLATLLISVVAVASRLVSKRRA